MLVEINGNQVFAGTGGKVFDEKKPIIIYLHGSGFSHIAWAPLAGQFTQKGFSVLVLDLPGHGNSEGPPLSSIEENAEWLGDLLQKLNLKKISIIGHSQGALTALEYASINPEMVSKLCLMSASYEMPVHPDLINMAESDDTKVVELMLKWCYSGHSGDILTEYGQILTNKKSIDVARMILRSKKTSEVLAVDLKACNNYTSGMNSSKKIKNKTLILSGNEDKMIPRNKVEDLHKLINNSTLNIIDNAGHMITSEEVVKVRAHLNAFFMPNDNH